MVVVIIGTAQECQRPEGTRLKPFQLTKCFYFDYGLSSLHFMQKYSLIDCLVAELANGSGSHPGLVHSITLSSIITQATLSAFNDGSRNFLNIVKLLVPGIAVFFLVQ